MRTSFRLVVFDAQNVILRIVAPTRKYYLWVVRDSLFSLASKRHILNVLISQFSPILYQRHALDTMLKLIPNPSARFF